MGRTLGLCGFGGTWESRGLPMVPLGLWDGKGSGTVVALGGTWESRGFPVVPLGLWDVLTGLRDCDGKLGHHSEKSDGLVHRSVKNAAVLCENQRERVAQI